MLYNTIKQNFNPKDHEIYVPAHKEKYKGKLPCIARSSWELQFMRWCDTNPNIIVWNSESLAISYFDPTSQKTRRYYPDFTIQIRNKEGKVITYIVEIKPKKETIPPKKTLTKKQKTFLNEQKTWMINKAKWDAATTYCNKYGYIFKIMTEKELFGKGK